MDTLEALRNSTKGRIHYDRNFIEEGRTQEILDEISRQIISLNISPKALTIINSSLPAKSKENIKPLSPVISSAEVIDKSPERNHKHILNKNDIDYLKRLEESEWPISEYENERINAAKELYEKKRIEYERFSSALAQRIQQEYEQLKSKKQSEITVETNPLKLPNQPSALITSNKVSLEVSAASNLEKERIQLDEAGEKQFVLRKKLLTIHELHIMNIDKLKEILESGQMPIILQDQYWFKNFQDLLNITHIIDKFLESKEILEDFITQAEQLVADGEDIVQEILAFYNNQMKLFQDSLSPKAEIQENIKYDNSISPKAQIQEVNTTYDNSYSPKSEFHEELNTKYENLGLSGDSKIKDNLKSDSPEEMIEIPNYPEVKETLAESIQTIDMEECDSKKESALEEEVKLTSEKPKPSLNVTDNLVEYVNCIETLKDQESALKAFSTDPRFKKYKLELHKAVTTPVNAISSCTGSHLRDKINRLISLLSGQKVSCGGKYTSCQNNPLALSYCKKLIAEKITNQGEEQIASQFATAFPFAAVTVAVCAKFPDVWQLMLGYFYKNCPYLVPYYPIHEEGQTDYEYYTSLGYKYIDDELEEKDKFLKRMSGFMRLYASILLTTSLMDVQGASHLHSLAQGWAWMAHTLNLEPRADVTPTLLFDFLEVVGNALEKTYGNQFKKLLHVLCTDFFQKIKLSLTSGSSGPVSRLQNFLQSAIKKGRIPQPDGLLPSSFLRT